jgi:hypothetical protein
LRHHVRKGFIRHAKATREEALFHIAGAETAATIAPDDMADDLGRTPMGFAAPNLHTEYMDHPMPQQGFMSALARMSCGVYPCQQLLSLTT